MVHSNAQRPDNVLSQGIEILKRRMSRSMTDLTRSHRNKKQKKKATSNPDNPEASHRNSLKQGVENIINKTFNQNKKNSKKASTGNLSSAPSFTSNPATIMSSQYAESEAMVVDIDPYYSQSTTSRGSLGYSSRDGEYESDRSVTSNIYRPRIQMPFSSTPSPIHVEGCGQELDQEMQRSNTPLGSHNEARIQRTRQTVDNYGKVILGDPHTNPSILKSGNGHSNSHKRVSFQATQGAGSASTTPPLGDTEIGGTFFLEEEGSDNEDDRNGQNSAASAADKKKKEECPWPKCSTKQEIHRLKEHIRRTHIFPFQCHSDECVMRFGDKAQIKRHIKTKHPDLSEDDIHEQNDDPLQLEMHKCLKPRNIPYDKIVQICQATCLEELPQRGPGYSSELSSPTTAISPISPDSNSPGVTGLFAHEYLIENDQEFKDVVDDLAPRVRSMLHRLGILTTDPTNPMFENAVNSVFDCLKRHVKQNIDDGELVTEVPSDAPAAPHLNAQVPTISYAGAGSVMQLQAWNPDNYMPHVVPQHNGVQPGPPSLDTNSTAQSPPGDCIQSLDMRSVSAHSHSHSHSYSHPEQSPSDKSTVGSPEAPEAPHTSYILNARENATHWAPEPAEEEVLGPVSQFQEAIEDTALYYGSGFPPYHY